MEKLYPTVKCLFLSLVLFILVIASVKAQDVIVKNDKSEVQAKVLEITDETIKYKQFQFQDGPVYNVKKTDVFMIIYQNGVRETFAASEKTATNNQTLSVIIATKPLPVKSENPNGKLVKNRIRIMLGFGGYKQDGYTEKALKGAYEKVNRLGFLSGIGFASNNFVDMFWYRPHGLNENGSPDGSGNTYIETIYGSKHYLSSYAFKELDTKFISVGVLAGPGVNLTRGTYSLQTWDASKKAYTYPINDVEASFFTVGLHTGVYLHKYLSTNKKGEKNFFVRLSFEQFVMAKGAYGSFVGLSFGL